MINKNEKDIFDLTEVEYEDDDSIYATREELNDEALIRARSDEAIINNLDIATETQNKKIKRINRELKQKTEIIDGFDNKLTNIANRIQNNRDQIDEISESLLEQVKKLEMKNQELKSKIEEANRIIMEKNNEIERLRQQVDDGPANDINLRFPETPKFKISEIMTVRRFISFYLLDLIVSQMERRYPEAELYQDYKIKLEELDASDLMQGKDIIVVVSATNEGILTGKSDFKIEVTYNYDIIQQKRFVDLLFQFATPVSLRKVPENARPNYNIPREIAAAKPLKLLLYNKEFKYLSFKIFAEMNAASYWTDFHRPWRMNINTYVGTGLSNIGGRLTINSINNLYNNNSGYHHYIFKLIEKRLNESGVSCVVNKRWVQTSNSGLQTLHNVGNLTFSIIDDTSFIKNRLYYMMVNFEVNIKGIRKFYRGVILALTDNLELY